MKTFTREQLQKILELHKVWLDSNGNEGKRADLSYADLSYTNLSEVDLTEANLSEANLYKANLSKAGLIEANLSEANLSEAYLSEADLTRANLSKANLYKANLYGAGLLYTNVFTFSLGKHVGYVHFGEQYEGGSLVKIGCVEGNLDWWIDNYKEMGDKWEYSEREIELYGNYLKYIRGIL